MKYFLKKFSILLTCLIAGLGTVTMTDTAYAGEASLWTLNASGDYITYKLYGPLVGWTATDYHHNADGTAQLLWNQTGQGVASLWTLKTDGELDTYRLYSVGAGWTATNYHRNGNGTAQLIWQRDSDGWVSLWTLKADGNLNTWKTYGPINGWRVTSYHRNVDGTAQLLWNQTDQGYASLWTLNTNGDLDTYKLYPVGAGWNATSYHRNSDGTAHLVWLRKSDKFTSVWTLRTDGELSTWKTYNVGWDATAYNGSSSSSDAGITSKSLSQGTLIVRKTGSGAGIISSSAQICDENCQELMVPYVEGEQIDVNVTPAANSYFAGWETADGAPLEDIYYANPGDKVIAVFEKK